MYNIMKATFYTFRKSKAVFYSIFIVLFVGLAIGFSTYMQDKEMIAAIPGNVENWMFNGFLIVMIFIATILGDDFRNKTIYYEVMNGHKRNEIILGRMIPTLLFSCIILWLGLIGTYSFGVIWGDWGRVLGSFNVIFIRYVLLVWNSLPFIAFCILSTFTARNIVTSIVLDWGVFILLRLPLLIRVLGIDSGESSNIWLYFNMRKIISHPVTYSFCFEIIIIGTIKFILIMILAIWLFKRADLE